MKSKRTAGSGVNDDVQAGAKLGPVGRIARALGSGRRQVFPLATTEIAGPLQFTRGGVFMWWFLGGEPWDFLTLPERIAAWDRQSFRFGRLADTCGEPVRPIRMRCTSRPYPAFEFARSLDEDTPDPLPQVEGGESWDDYLGLAQERLRTRALDENVTALGLWIGPAASTRVRRDLIEGCDEVSRDTKPYLDQLDQVSDIMTGQGLSAVPATGREMAFLLHRSLSMGVPVPAHAGVGGERWEATDLAEFTDRREWIAEPFAPTVEIVSEVNGFPTKRHVAVVTCGPMPSMRWPDNGRDPWLMARTRLGFPIEVEYSGLLMKGSTLRSVAESEHRRAENVRDHYEEHHLTPPPAVHRAIQAASENLDEVESDSERVSARFVGTVRFAVVGATREEALGRARKLIDFYGERVRMPLVRTTDQVNALREFVPGEPRVLGSWQRRMPVRYLAAAMPNVESKVGTPTGPYFGYGIGVSRRAARFDMHYGPERKNASGLFTITAEPGAGKSVLIGSLAYSAVRAGEPTIILDPSGPLAKLCALREFAGCSRVIDLTESEPGTLAPYGLVPQPRTEDYVDADGHFNERQYLRAQRRAHAERQQLMFDVFRMWLPPSMLRGSQPVDVLLREAIRETGEWATEHLFEDVQINPRWVLQRIEGYAKSDRSDADLARQVAAELSAAAEFPLGELIMPAHDEWMREASGDDKLLVVVTMPGLTPPPDTEPEFWGAEERYTQPLLHLAAFFTSRFVYGRPRTMRKNLFLDENHLMGQWGSGRAFFVRVGRDSRKFNLAVGAASQDPDDHLGIGKLRSVTGGAFVGRLTDPDAAQRACQLVQRPVEFAGVIQSLSPKGGPGEAENSNAGEFVWLDPLGQHGKIRVDRNWHPSLVWALETTPGRVRTKTTVIEQPAPFIDPELFDMIDTAPLSDPREAVDELADLVDGVLA